MCGPAGEPLSAASIVRSRAGDTASLADTLDLLLRGFAVPAEGPPAHHRCTLGDPTLPHSGALDDAMLLSGSDYASGDGEGNTATALELNNLPIENTLRAIARSMALDE